MTDYRLLLKRDDGFTIQELLVAMVAGSLLVGFAFSLYLFVARIVQTDARAREHRESVQRAVQLIASDVERASEVLALTDSSLELLSAMRGKIVYRFDRSRLYRGMMLIGPSEGAHWSLTLKSPSAGTVAVELRSFRGRDSTLARTKVSVPQSSATAFRQAMPTR